jgi:hypothetical protein
VVTILTLIFYSVINFFHNKNNNNAEVNLEITSMEKKQNYYAITFYLMNILNSISILKFRTSRTDMFNIQVCIFNEIFTTLRKL